MEKKKSPVLGFSVRSLESQAWFDPKSCSWRMWETSFLEKEANGCERYVEKFHKSGMIVNGQYWPLKKSVLGTKGTGSGLFATPGANDGNVESLDSWEKRRDKKAKDGINLHRKLPIQIQQQARSGLWPTPRAGNPGSRPNGKGGKILAEEVKKSLFPTPTTSDSNSADPKHDHERSILRGVIHDINDSAHEANKKGQLNPEWVSWLMGYPIGYTDIRIENKDLPEFYGWHKEPPILRLTTEREHRVNRLKALGNGVVPQCVETIARKIKDYLERL